MEDCRARISVHVFDCRCLRYMSDYTNCLMRGYGVVPSAPTNVRVRNIDTTFAIVHWDAPKSLADSVTHYNVHYRQSDDIYMVVRNVSTVLVKLFMIH